MIIPTRYTPLPKRIFLSLCCEMKIKGLIIILHQYKFLVVKLQQVSGVTLAQTVCLRQHLWSQELIGQKGKTQEKLQKESALFHFKGTELKQRDVGMGHMRFVVTETTVATLNPASSDMVRLKLHHDMPKNVFPDLQFVLTCFCRNTFSDRFLKSA